MIVSFHNTTPKKTPAARCCCFLILKGPNPHSTNQINQKQKNFSQHCQTVNRALKHDPKTVILGNDVFSEWMYCLQPHICDNVEVKEWLELW